MSTWTRSTAVALALFICARGAAGQQSTTRGFNIGVNLQGSSFQVEQEPHNDGGGAGIHLGYGVNRIVTLYVDIGGSQYDFENPAALRGTWDMFHYDLGARFHVADSRRRWVPYGEVAVGGRSVSAALIGGPSEEVRFDGATFSLGGGLNLYVSRSWALDANLSWSGGEFDEITVGNVTLLGQDVDAVSARFKFGIVWWP